MPPSSDSPDPGSARLLRIRRFAGLGISTAVLAKIASRFAALRSHVLLQADGRTFNTIDELIECVIEDMAVGHVFMAVMDDEWRSLLFLYRPETIVVQTDSLQDAYCATFQSCVDLLAAQPPTGTALCDIVVTASAYAQRSHAPLMASLAQWWRSSTRSSDHEAGSRRR